MAQTFGKGTSVASTTIVAPKTDLTSGTDSDPRGLLIRVERALQALGHCRSKTSGGLEAVAELRDRLAILGPTLGVDLREVQESVVEHAAMYANCPEVLGGMLQLVFCLDVVCAWVAERDARCQDFQQRIVTVETCLRECRDSLVMLADEMKVCAERAAALELSGELGRVAQVLENRPMVVHQPQRAAQMSQSEQLCVDLQELMRTEETLPSAPDEETRKLSNEIGVLREELDYAKRDNSALRVELERALAATEALEAAAAAAAIAAPAATGSTCNVSPPPQGPAPTIAMGSMFVPCGGPTTAFESAVATAATNAANAGPPAQRMLLWLEQMEPMLAALPVGIVPGMEELQEDACDAYARLRATLWEAASKPQPHVATVPGGSQSRGAWYTTSAAGLPMASMSQQGAAGGMAPPLPLLTAASTVGMTCAWQGGSASCTGASNASVGACGRDELAPRH